MVAQELALAHPDRVRCVILAATGGGSERRWTGSMRAIGWRRSGPPTLILHGTEDGLIDAENARILASLIPGAELVFLEQAGHVYHSEQPEVADRAVLEFIQRRRHG